MNSDVLTGLLMAVTLLAATALATRPWWRGSSGRPQDRKAANVAAYRLRVAELEAETASGLIPPDEAAALRSELDARVLADAGESGAEPAERHERRLLAAMLVAVLLALFAVGWYSGSGSWRVQHEIAKGPDVPKPTVDPQIAVMVDKLAGKLREQPDDPKGWSMLGRSYFVMQRYAEAAQAYGEANARGTEPNVEWLTDEGEALAFAGNREVDARSGALFERALKLAPGDGKALWYGGLGAAQRGDFAIARTRWQLLLQAKDLPDTMRTALEERMKTLDEAIAGAGAAPGDQPPAQGTAAPAGPGLRVAVSLAPELASRVPAGATLFVFAKAESGPQIPLAVQRLPAAKLPVDVTLDDSMAMAPTLRLSQFERYIVTARLSAGGGALAQSGDLEGRIAASHAQAGGAALELRIDHRVP